MCLVIPQNPAFQKPTKNLIVYKTYNYRLEQINGKEALVIKPIYQGKQFVLRNNLTIVSNREYINPTHFEITTSRIDQGLHAWTAKKKAVELACTNSGRIVLKFEGRPENFVCKGQEGDIVFHKLNFVGIVGTVKSYLQDFKLYTGEFENHLVGNTEVNV